MRIPSNETTTLNKSFVPNYSKERGDLQMNKYRVGFVVFQTVNAPSIREPSGLRGLGSLRRNLSGGQRSVRSLCGDEVG